MRRGLPLMAVLVVAALATSASALMIKVPLDELATGAASILQGRVVSLRSAWTPDNRTIETEVSVAVDAAWKGAVPAERNVTLRVAGGEVGDVGVMVEHAPVFAEGENVVLFLENAPDGDLRVRAEEQGKYTIVNEWIVGAEHRPVKLADFRAEIGRYVPAEGR